MIGKTIDRYKIQKELGRGNMGVVYRARQSFTEKIVALKLLDGTKIKDEPGMEERFKEEAKAAAAMEHENIVRTFDGGYYRKKHYFLAMEYVEGATISDMLAKLGNFPEREALSITKKIALALDYVHKRDKVHRDVKSSNIIIRRDNAEPVLTDFGIVQTDTGAPLTRTGFLVGTPCYMSPEQINGNWLGGASDLYSLGVVLYEMLTGRVPFKGPHEIATIVMHLNNQPPPIRSLLPGISKEAEAIVNRLLEKKPEDRYATGKELATAIDAALHVQAEQDILLLDGLSKQHVMQLMRESMNQGTYTLDQTGETPLYVFALKNSKKVLVATVAAFCLLLVSLGPIRNYLLTPQGMKGNSKPQAQILAHRPDNPHNGAHKDRIARNNRAAHNRVARNIPDRHDLNQEINLSNNPEQPAHGETNNNAPVANSGNDQSGISSFNTGIAKSYDNNNDNTNLEEITDVVYDPDNMSLSFLKLVDFQLMNLQDTEYELVKDGNCTAFWEYSNLLNSEAKDSVASVSVNNNLGVCYAWAKTPNKNYAIQSFKTALEIAFDNGISLDVIYFNFGTFYYNQGDYDNAIDYFTKSLEANSKNVASLMNRGNAWFREGEYGKALNDYILADKSNINATYEPSYLRYSIAQAHYRNGNCNEALRYYGNVDAGENAVFASMVDNGKGEAYAACGRMEEAIASFERAAYADWNTTCSDVGVKVLPLVNLARLYNRNGLLPDAAEGMYDRAQSALTDVEGCTETPSIHNVYDFFYQTSGRSPVPGRGNN